MAKYANQLRINLINLDKIKHQYKSRNRFIAAIDYKYEEAAMRNLNGNAFKLWRYFLRWYGKEYVFFSPTAINEALGFGKNGATAAREELEKKGYITAIPDKLNTYIFTPVLPVDYENLKKKNDFFDASEIDTDFIPEKREDY